MKYAQPNGDVRGTSADLRYLDTEGFVGTLDEALAQAKARPDHGNNPGNERRELLKFLRVPFAHRSAYAARMDDIETAMDHDALNAWIEARSAPVDPYAHLGIYSTAYAVARGWIVPRKSLVERLEALTDSQFGIYWRRRRHSSIEESLDYAEQYPYPAVRS
jgi:hypothetical protein